MVENILVYKTSNELKQIVKVDGILKMSVISKPCDETIAEMMKQDLISNVVECIQPSDIMHKLCLYDVSELEHLETDVDDIYHVPNKILLINECAKRYFYDEHHKLFTVGINLGSERLPDWDAVEYKLNYKYHITHHGSNLFIGSINPNIEVLKYGKEIV